MSRFIKADSPLGKIIAMEWFAKDKFELLLHQAKVNLIPFEYRNAN